MPDNLKPSLQRFTGDSIAADRSECLDQEYLPFDLRSSPGARPRPPTSLVGLRIWGYIQVVWSLLSVDCPKVLRLPVPL